MKIASVKYGENKKIGKLNLDFINNKTGEPYKNIILVGENGAGKTTILKNIAPNDMRWDLEIDEEKIMLDEYDNIKNFRKTTGGGSINFYTKEGEMYSGNVKSFSVDIETRNMSNPTNKEPKIDDSSCSKMEVEKLLTSFISQDNDDIINSIKSDNNYTGEEIIEKRRRMNRFINAYKFFFNNIDIKNIDGTAKIYKDGREIPIKRLSSGEKQIIYRAAQIITQQKILEGTIILIDEPEMNLHPAWEKKIFGFYKHLLTINNIQKSQLIIATQSEYVLMEALEEKGDTLILMIRKDENGIVSCKEYPNSPILPYQTYAEIKYSLFNLPTTDFLNELCGYIHEYLGDVGFEQVNKFIKETKKDIRIEEDIEQLYSKKNCTPIYIRHAICHPEYRISFTNEMLEYSIKCLVEIVEKINNKSVMTIY